MPRPRPHDDALRTTLVELASQAVADGGSQSFSLRTLATSAGTTTAAVYTLFGGRDGLLRAVVEEGFRRFAAHLAAAPTSTDPAADLLALGLAYRRSALDAPHFYRVMFGGTHAGGAPDEALGRPTFAVLKAAVSRLLREDGTTAGGAHAVSLRLWALVHGMVSLELAGLLPGEETQREEQYLATLRAARP